MPFTNPNAPDAAEPAADDVADSRITLSLARCQEMMEPALFREKAVPINRELAQQNLILRKIHPNALDATLHKIVFNDLCSKGIILLPTPRIFDTFLPVELIHNLVADQSPIPVTSDIRIQDGQIKPTTPVKSCRTTHGLQFVVHPMRSEVDGYGLLIIDFTNRPVQSDDYQGSYLAAGAYYFAMNQEARRDESIKMDLQRYLRQINIPFDNLEIKHLQRENQKYSAEYLIALLQEIASPEFHLRQLSDLNIFDSAPCEETIPEYIQLSQICLFGPMYYGFLQNEALKNLSRRDIYEHLTEIFPQVDKFSLIDHSFDLRENIIPPGSPVMQSSTKRSQMNVIPTRGHQKFPGNSMKQTLAALQQLSLLRKKPETIQDGFPAEDEGDKKSARSQFV